MINYTNGNANISISSNGTRIIEFPDNQQLKLSYPLNIDIRLSTQCAFGLNPKTGKSVCSFCHESATTDGLMCNFEELKDKLRGLPPGIELAIGCNYATIPMVMIYFLIWCNEQRYICNITVNQGHIKSDNIQLGNMITDSYIKGLGISYRANMPWRIPKELLEYENTVFHVIMGIDTIQDVEKLAERGVKKILVLGEKDFGFNKGNVNLNSKIHRDWQMFIPRLFKKFSVVSFDNLALEQLELKRLFSDDTWNTFNQGEHSFYIDAVSQEFARSSRSSDRVSWKGLSVHDYFKMIDVRLPVVLLTNVN